MTDLWLAYYHGRCSYVLGCTMHGKFLYIYPTSTAAKNIWNYNLFGRSLEVKRLNITVFKDRNGPTLSKVVTIKTAKMGLPCEDMRGKRLLNTTTFHLLFVNTWKLLPIFFSIYEPQLPNLYSCNFSNITFLYLNRIKCKEKL